MKDLFFQVDFASELRVLEHLQACDNNFSPPLSTRVDLRLYSRKLCTLGRRFECWHHDLLAGLVVAYLNKISFECYITNVSVLCDYSGHGIGRALLTNCINSSSHHGMQVARLHVSTLNTPAVRLYERIGFNICSQSSDQFEMIMKLNKRPN
jgi:ribosomal protein S18 acetylase RimI-like enzyme